MASPMYDVIQSLWIGKELTTMEVLCIQSYLQNGHPFHLYIYDDVKNIPSGTTIKNAGEIIPQADIYADQWNGFVNFSNRFRYTLLYQKGGWWVDMDTVCLKPFTFTDDYVFSSEAVPVYRRIAVNTTYIKAKAGNRLFRDCLDFIDNRKYEHLHWGEHGVNLISRMIFLNNLQPFIKTPDFFCPVSAFELKSLIEPGDMKLISQSYAVHWWHELWRRKGLDKSAQFDPGSIYEKIKSKYLA
jgi:mannosyltransferase OCH1-like enzyme